MTQHKIYTMPFAKVYPLYIQKVERKGRTKAEVDAVIFWLTGYDTARLAEVVENEMTFVDFFEAAPEMNPARHLITGSICGVKVENIEAPLMQNIRYLDKLIDELAKGKTMEKILRKA